MANKPREDIYHADRHTVVDHDDGMKMNHAKFGDLRVDMKAVAGATKE
jgi:hypothetical protein